MPTQGWNQALVTQRSSGRLLNNYTTAVSIINAQDLYGFYANYFNLGTKLRARLCLTMSNIVTTPGTITFQVMLGSTVVWSSGPVALNINVHTLMPAWLDIELTCQLTNTGVGGAIAKLMGVGKISGSMFTRTAGQSEFSGTDVTIVLPQSTPALGTAFDSTISQVFDIWAGFSIGNAGNAIRCDQYELESLCMPSS